jgi:copper chaperone CopZ
MLNKVKSRLAGKKLFILFCLAMPFVANAQVSKVTLQASGLTCSMCTNAIHKSLKGLDFVNDITVDIKNSTFLLGFKADKAVDFDKIKAAVEDAGFFVAKFYAVVNFNKVQAANDSHLTVNGLVLHFLNIKSGVLDGEKTIRLLDKGFVSNKEYKKNKGLTQMACYQTGVAAACCTKGGLPVGTRVFHVTI